MSDFDQFMSSFGGADASEKKPKDNSGLSDFEHFLATLGEGALRTPANIAGMVADVVNDAPGIVAPGSRPVHLPGLGPAAEAIGQSFNKAEDEYTKGKTPRPQSDFEEFVNAVGQGVGGGLVGGPEAVGKAVAGGVIGGLTGEGVYKATGSPTAAYLAGLVGGGLPFLRDHIIPSLEGGGSVDEPKTSPKGAFGPMQVMPDTLRQPGHGIKPWDGTTEDSVRVGKQLAEKLYEKYDGDTEKVLAAYNWGEGNLDKAIAKHGNDWFYHAPEETQHYVLNGMLEASRGGGSTGSPVPPMNPDDIMRAMGEDPNAPALPEIAPDDGRVIDASDVFENKIDAENDKQIRENLDIANRIHDAIDRGALTEDHIPNIKSALENVKRIEDQHSDLLTPDQQAMVRDNINLLIEALDRLGGHDISPSDIAVGTGQHIEIGGINNHLDEVFGQPREASPANENQNPRSPEGLDVLRQMVDDYKDSTPPLTVQDNSPPGKPPSGGEPPFGGGGNGEEPPKGGGNEPEDKYAGSINLDRMAISDAAKQKIREAVAPMNMDIETFHETRQKTADYIDKHGVEGVLDRETLPRNEVVQHDQAVRAINAAAAEHFLKLNEAYSKVRGEGGYDPVLHYRYIKAAELFAKSTAQNNEIGKLAGRGLGARRIVVGGDSGELGDKLSELINNKAEADHLNDLVNENPELAGKIVRDAMKPGMNEVIFTTWYAMLLSSLKTLAKNIFSNTLMNTLDSAIVHPVAAGIGLLHGGEKVTFRATLAGLSGLAQGSILGLKNAPEAYRRGSPSDMAERTQAYWKPENKGFGRVLSAPMRVLSAQDQVFLDAAQNAEYFRMAHIKAAKEGLSGDDYKARVKDLLENPTKEMEKQAVKYAQMMRFQDPMEFKGLEYATRATPKDPLIIKIMKGFLRILFPFPRNSDRMFFAAMRNSPLGILEPQNLRDFRAGGAKRDVAMARVLVGTGMAMGIYMWAANGGITGANPSDPSKKFMINIGPMHISYQGLADPFSTTMASIATAVEDARSGTKDLYSKIFNGTKDLLGVLMSSTWATGASQFFQAADDNTGKTMQAWVGRMASSFTTPAIVREINQDYVDPTVRNTKQNPISDTIKAGIPGLSKTLPARHDAFGDKIVRENPGYLNAINPARIQIDKYPELSKALSNVASDTPLLSKAPKSVTINGVKHQLSARGQEKYQAVSGQIFRQMMEQNVSYLQSLPNEDKVKLVRKTLSDARKQARQELWGASR